MRSSLILGVVAMATATTLLHCASSREAPAVDGGAPNDSAPSSDASVEIDADISDATTEDELVLPDGAVACEVTPCAVAIGGARGPGTLGRFCALLEDKTVQCWGSNLKKVLGYEIDAGENGLPMSSSPHPIPSLSGVTNLSFGGDNACARVEDGSIYCWGDPALVSAGMDRDGGPPLDVPVLPTRQDLVPTSTSVAVGSGTACVTLGDGGGSCWGRNDDRELTQPTADSFGPPTSIPNGGRTLSLVQPGGRWDGLPGGQSDGWIFASATTGELLSWGASRCSDTLFSCSFILGRDTSENPDPIPQIVPGLVNVRAIASGPSHVCAILGREVQCWGDNSRGQLGRGSVTNRSELPAPTVLSAVATADDTDAGIAPRVDVPLQIVADASWSTYVVMGSGRVFRWGPGPRDERPPYEWGHPARFDAPSGPVVALATTNDAFCALLRTGAVECWGMNILGTLGRGIDDSGFTDPKPAPVVFPQ